MFVFIDYKVDGARASRQRFLFHLELLQMRTLWKMAALPLSPPPSLQFQALLTQFVTCSPKTTQTGQNYPVKLGRQQEDGFQLQTIPKQTTEVQSSQLRYWDLESKPGLLIRRPALSYRHWKQWWCPFFLNHLLILSSILEDWKISNMAQHPRLMKLFLQEGMPDRIFWLFTPILRTDAQLYLSNYLVIKGSAVNLRWLQWSVKYWSANSIIFYWTCL